MSTTFEHKTTTTAIFGPARRKHPPCYYLVMFFFCDSKTQSVPFSFASRITSVRGLRVSHFNDGYKIVGSVDP